MIRFISGLLLVCFTMSSAQGQDDKYFEIAKNLEIFSSIYKELNANYVDELDPNTMMKVGIDAMLEKMDPYTRYYSESQAESYRLSDDNKYNGLGANSAFIDDKVTIVEIYQDGPAQKAGLKVGDQISSINGKTTADRSYDDVMTFLRGFPGTSVQLGVYRPEEDKKVSVELTRSAVDVPNVPYHGMLDDQIGYITLTTFTKEASKNIRKALRELKNDNDLKGLVLDLRDNGGGLLAEAIDILGIFLPEGSPVVSTKGKVRENNHSYDTRRTPLDTELPIVVLINGRSASASEIVSGALQDYDRAVIMGQRSFGKGLVQNFKEVGYNSRMKLTTHKYYIPSGRCIQALEYKNGVPVDIPDDRREVFRTKNGRPVLDGGGVTPDVKLPAPSPSEALLALEKDNWIFKYVNQYVKEHPEAPAKEDLNYDRYDDFVAFVQEGGFEYQTKVEKTLEQLVTEATEANLSSDVQTIVAKIQADKADDLQQYKGEISKAIEVEIAKRYHFQTGKAYQKLKNDSEIDAAIKILKDASSYQSTLQS